MFSNINAAVRSSGIGRWYYDREASERRIISALGILTVLLIVWAYVWTPVADWRSAQQQRQQVAQQTVDWLRSNEAAARQSAKRANANASQGTRALIQIINKAAKAHDLRLNRLQPDSNGVVSVVLQDQPFNQIISWISQLEENNKIYVQRANFDQQGTSGYVNAQLRLN